MKYKSISTKMIDYLYYKDICGPGILIYKYFINSIKNPSILLTFVFGRKVKHESNLNTFYLIN